MSTPQRNSAAMASLASPARERRGAPVAPSTPKAGTSEFASPSKRARAGSSPASSFITQATPPPHKTPRVSSAVKQNGAAKQTRTPNQTLSSRKRELASAFDDEDKTSHSTPTVASQSGLGLPAHAANLSPGAKRRLGMGKISNLANNIFSPLVTLFRGQQGNAMAHLEVLDASNNSPSSSEGDISLEDCEATAELNIDDDDCLSVCSSASVESFLDTLETDDDDSNPFAFMARALQLSADSPPEPKGPFMPDASPTTEGKPTLVLDLDETLVHARVEPMQGAQIRFSVQVDGVDYPVWVKKRPGVDEFLQHASKLFEVVVFTASQRVYADQVLDKLDPTGIIKHRLFRESCVDVDQNYVKELSVVNRDLSKVVIVDNTLQVFALQPDNGIPIKSWYGSDDADTELTKLSPFLEKIALAKDVRPLVRRRFGVHKRMLHHVPELHHHHTASYKVAGMAEDSSRSAVQVR